jgi:ribosome recycling factor
MWQNTVKNYETKMKKAVEATASEFSRLRTGRANPALLDTVRVEYYGSLSPLKQLATVSAPEPRMMVIQPFDAGSVAAIGQAIQSADLGLTPIIEGKMIRVPVPALSKERREDLVKLVKKVAEDGRVSIRNARREGNEEIKKLEKDKKITEDERKKAEDQIQKLTDAQSKAIDDLASAKEKELMTV